MPGKMRKVGFHSGRKPGKKGVPWLPMTVVFVIGLFCADMARSRPYTFAGGPAGGTYTHYAAAVASLSSTKERPIRAMASRGSIENIKKVHTGMANFGIAYSGDIFKGRNGQLKSDVRKYRKVMAV